MPAITADAALVPCALDGIRQTSRRCVAVGPVVGADRQQPGELALRAGVGLQRHRVVAGDLGQPAPRAGRSARGSPAACSTGANGCMPANSGQVIGSISAVALSFIVHEPSGIIDAVEREVLVGEPAQVAQHRGLGAVRVEHRVGQEARRARSSSAGSAVLAAPAGRRRTRRPSTPNAAQTVAQVLAGRGLVAGDRRRGRRRRRRRLTPALAGRGDDRVGAARRRGQDGVEERRRARPRRRRARSPAASDAACRCTRAGDRRAARPGRGRRRTCRPSTASSTCAVQMLLVAFSRRMCCSRVCSASRYAGCAVGVHGHADQPAGQLPLAARRAPPCSRRAGRRSPAARRSAAWCRPRCRRRARPAARAGSARAGRRRRRPARPRSCAARDQRASGRGPRRSRPGTAAARRRRRRRAARRACRSATTTSMPSGSARVREHGDASAAARRRRRRTRALAALPARRAQRHRLGGRGAPRRAATRSAIGQPGEVGDHRSGS